MGVEYILKNSLLRRTLDNVTVVMIAFSNFKHACFGKASSQDELTTGHSTNRHEAKKEN
jgi:hypothetical protein